MELRFPRASHSSHFPFILLFISEAYFWSVVVWKIIDGQPPQAKAPPISPFFSSFHLVAPNDGTTPPPPPMQSNPVASPLQLPLYCGRQQSVDCYVMPLNGDHLRPQPAFLSIFNGACVGAPNKGTNCGAAKPDGAHLAQAYRKRWGTMIWWHRCPTHGGRGRSRWG